MYDAKRLSEVAAQWRTDKLRGPARIDVGAAWQNVLAMALSRPPVVTEESLAKFQTLLAGRIATALVSAPVCPCVTLHVDYAPDQLLEDAALESGVNCERFPVKSHMRVSLQDGIEARCGYSGALERLPLEPTT